MAKFQFRENSASFDYEACRLNCGCDIDPIKTLVEGYKVFVSEKFENCLKAKWSVGDCVAGCHNDFYTETDSSRRNSHQRRLSKELIAKLSAALESATDFPDSPADFEKIYEWVGHYVETVRNDLLTAELEDPDDSEGEEDIDSEDIDAKGELSIDICPLLKYDTALRMACNMAGPDGKLIPLDENGYLPRAQVYLQRGALFGARALWKITVLSNKEADLTPKRKPFILKDYINLAPGQTLDGPTVIDKTIFNSDLQSLGAYHLENFLCVYHRMLEDWATGYEIRVNKLAEQKNDFNNKYQ